MDKKFKGEDEDVHGAPPRKDGIGEWGRGLLGDALVAGGGYGAHVRRGGEGGW